MGSGASPTRAREGGSFRSAFALHGETLHARAMALPSPRQSFLLLLAWFALLLPSHAADVQRPNIIWIVGEDTGPEMGCYGDKQAITPNFDRLAREGARFTRCFTH